MPILVPIIPFIRRRRRAAPIAPPAALVLVGATLMPESVVLAFDRAIDLAGLDGAVIFVDDYESGSLYQGTQFASLLNPTTAEIGMVIIDSSTGTQILLTAGAGNGIVAVDDGGAWAGVTDVELPFP